MFRTFLVATTRNPTSLTGVALTTASALVIAALFAFELVGFVGNPYVGILAYLVLPAFFLAGLCLIPVGILVERRRARRRSERGEPAALFPVIDLNQDRTRRLALTFGLFTLANLIILATVTYKAVEVMESTEFCGEACHSVMAPEFTVYSRSPHARVSCVECHIGPGADWFAKSKLSGAWQVVSVNLELYPKPIPTPIHDLRPARETCEQCHWPTKFVGDRLKVLPRYQNDEENTETQTVLLLRVGGIQGRESQGIHWHVDPANRIRYLSDLSRETIYDVELTNGDGTVTRYSIDEDPPEETEWRVMDCVDCHNRPSHIYRMPEQEIDTALSQGRIDRALPFVRRTGVELLREDYPSQEAAREGIVASLQDYYRENYPDLAVSSAETIRRAGEALGAIWSTNVHPRMKVDWGTYPNHIGHEDSPGCFRCHDDLHESEGGKTISQDCDTCHSLLAIEEEDPEILAQLRP